MALYHYVISYQVPAEVDAKPSGTIRDLVCEWLMEESVCSYTRSTTCVIPECKIEHRLQFSTIDAWVDFVEHSNIDRDLYRLQQSVEDFSTNLWKTGGQGQDITANKLSSE